mgnify:CR=1
MFEFFHKDQTIEYLKKCYPVWECQNCYRVQDLQKTNRQFCENCGKECIDWKEHIYTMLHPAFMFENHDKNDIL